MLVDCRADGGDPGNRAPEDSDEVPEERSQTICRGAHRCQEDEVDSGVAEHRQECPPAALDAGTDLHAGLLRVCLLPPSGKPCPLCLVAPDTEGAGNRHELGKRQHEQRLVPSLVMREHPPGAAHVFLCLSAFCHAQTSNIVQHAHACVRQPSDTSAIYRFSKS